MIALICTQCGAPLEVEKDESVFVSDNVAILRSGTRLLCTHCGTEFLPGDELGTAQNNVAIIGDGNIVGNGNVVVNPFNQTGQRVGQQINIVADADVVESGATFVGARIGVIGNGVTVKNGIRFGK